MKEVKTQQKYKCDFCRKRSVKSAMEKKKLKIYLSNMKTKPKSRRVKGWKDDYVKSHVKRVKGWAVVSRGGVLIGGGDKHWGYTELCVYSAKGGARISPTRPTDIVVPCTISFSLPPNLKKK